MNILGEKFEALVKELIDSLEPAEVRKFMVNLSITAETVSKLLQEIRDGKVALQIQLRRLP